MNIMYRMMVDLVLWDKVASDVDLAMDGIVGLLSQSDFRQQGTEVRE